PPRPRAAAGRAALRAGGPPAFEVAAPGPPDRHAAWARRDPAAPWPAGSDTAPAFRAPLSSRPAQVVELVDVTPFTDPLAPAGMVLTAVTWRAEDALVRPYPVGIDAGHREPQGTVGPARAVPAPHRPGAA